MRKVMLGGILALAVSAPAMVPVGVSAGAEKSEGTFASVPGHGDWGVTGTAELKRLPSDRTKVKVKVEGLEAGKTYPSHVHNQPCADGGGSHYKHDPAGPNEPPNELWPSSNSSSPGLVANKKGKAVGTDKADWRARPEAQSVVIHHWDDPSIRVACAQLS